MLILDQFNHKDGPRVRAICFQCHRVHETTQGDYDNVGKQPMGVFMCPVCIAAVPDSYGRKRNQGRKTGSIHV